MFSFVSVLFALHHFLTSSALELIAIRKFIFLTRALSNENNKAHFYLVMCLTILLH